MLGILLSVYTNHLSLNIHNCIHEFQRLLESRGDLETLLFRRDLRCLLESSEELELEEELELDLCRRLRYSGDFEDFLKGDFEDLLKGEGDFLEGGGEGDLSSPSKSNFS